MKPPMRVALVTTHPVQYQVPWIRKLASEPDIDLHVYYAMVPDVRQQGAGFGVEFSWDLPLLEGYAHSVLRNVSKQPSLVTFSGCDTPDIFREVREGQWDAVIVNGWGVKSTVQAVLAARLSGVPCLVRGEVNGLRKRRWAIHLAHAVLFRLYAGFLAIGSPNRSYYRSHGAPATKIFWTPYGVDNRFFQLPDQQATEGRQRLRSKYGVPEDAVCLLFCGKFEHKKRPLQLIEAFSRLRPSASGCAVHLLMVGDGELRKQCEQAAAGHAVHFSGFMNQREIVAAYAATDLLVLPSDAGETWGLVVNEAMAAGLPAVVSDHVGCHEDLVVAGETGAVFPLDDVTALTEALQALVDNPVRLRAMGANAQLKVQAFSIDAVVAGCLDGLRSVCR